MTDQQWDPMDPNSTPPIRKPGELWVFVNGKGWIHLSAEDVREIEALTDNHILYGNPSAEPLKGIFQVEEKFKPFPVVHPFVAKIKAEQAGHLDPVWMVKALNIPLHYRAPAPRYWSDHAIFSALGSDAPVVRIILGDLDIVGTELAAEFGDTSPLPELRVFIQIPLHPWSLPEEG